MKQIHFIFIILLLFSIGLNAQNKRQLAAQKRDSVFKFIIQSRVKEMNNVVATHYQVQDDLELINDTLPNGSIVQMMIVDGDTNYIYNMNTFVVVDLKPYGDTEKDKQFRRMRYYVKRVYPYARIAADKLMEYDEQIKNVKSNRQRKKLMKLREKALKEEFEDVIKKMSKTSGRVLIKLIHRETGRTTYEIIKEMRGTVKAWTYQGIGKLYGNDLKEKYDPKTNEEDEMIERVVESLKAEGALFY